jgi:protein SCO1/2
MASSVAWTVSRFVRNSRLVALLGVVLAIGVRVGIGVAGASDPAPGAHLPFYSRADFTAEWLVPGSHAARRSHRIARFSFVDQDGRTVSNETLRGKIYVANFFFSTCHSICPRMAASFARIQRTFANDPGVVLLSHTVDPRSDTIERLHAYGESFGVRSNQWHLLTGERDAIYRLARRSYFAEKTLGMTRTANEFLHTENMILVDGDGHIRGIYNGTLLTEATRAIEDIRMLRRERQL